MHYGIEGLCLFIPLPHLMVQDWNPACKTSNPHNEKSGQHPGISSVAEDVALQLPHGTRLQLCKEANRLKHNQAFHDSTEKVRVLSVLSWDKLPTNHDSTEGRKTATQ